MSCFVDETFNHYTYWLTGEQVWSPSTMHYFLDDSNICVCGKTQW